MYEIVHHRMTDATLQSSNTDAWVNDIWPAKCPATIKPVLQIWVYGLTVNCQGSYTAETQQPGV